MMMTMAMMTMTINMIMLIYDISATKSAARRWWNTEAIDLNDDYDDNLDYGDHFEDDIDQDDNYGNDGYDHHHDYADL